MDVVDVTTPARAREATGATVRLLGVPRIDPGGSVNGRRTQLCLAVLASPPGRLVARDRLADVIWEDRPPRSWQAALRNVIAELRAAFVAAGLDSGVVESTGSGYRLALPAGTEVDVDVLAEAAGRAEQALRDGDHATAAALGVHLGAAARETALAGLDGDWAETTRRSTQELVARLAAAAGEAALLLDDARRAESLGQLLVRLAPLREDGYRLQMRALLVSGNRAEALRVYEACRALLAEELGAAPSEATRALMTAALAEDPATDLSPDVSPTTLTVSDVVWRRALRYGLAAARTGWSARVYEDTVAMAGRALDVLAAAGDPDPVGRLDLQILTGGARRVLGDPAGTQLLHAAWAEAKELGDPNRMADAALAFSEEGSNSDEAHLDDALLDLYQETYDAVWPGEARRRTRLLGHIAVGRSWRTDAAGGRRAARNAVALARHLDDPALLMSVLSTARLTLSGSGDPAEQGALEDELQQLAEQIDDPGVLARVALWRFETRLESGQGDDLEEVLGSAATYANGLRAARYRYHLAYSRATLAMLRGDLVTAEELIGEAATFGMRHGLAGEVVEGIRLVQLTALRGQQGRLPELHDRVVEYFTRADLPAWQVLVALAEAAVPGREVQLAAAVDIFLDSYTRTGSTVACPVGVAASLAGPVELLGDPDRARRLYDLVTPHSGLGGVYAHFAGPIDHALGVLARTFGENVLAAKHFTAGAAFSRRLGAPLWVERCEQDAAGLA